MAGLGRKWKRGGGREHVVVKRYKLVGPMGVRGGGWLANRRRGGILQDRAGSIKNIQVQGTISRDF